MATPDSKLYWYKVDELVSAYDGDTVRFRLDLGFSHSAEIAGRLEGIDTPEIGKEGALAARDYLRGRLEKALKDNRDVIVRTFKSEKYGRWLMRIYIGAECLNDTMVEKGLGKPYDGGTR